jgi:hypothetical protein
MLVLGLIRDPDWEPEGWDLPEDPEPHRRPNWRIPWRPLAWLAAWCWLMALVPIVSDAFGGLAGFGVLIAALALGLWRIERWCARQYWQGLREHKS